MSKPAKKVARSFDHLATRQMIEAIVRKDLRALDNALRHNADPNKQKSLNRWSPPTTPLITAVQHDFPQGVALLIKHGARRRPSGKGALSAYAHAVSSRSPAAFGALEQRLGPMTQSEILESFGALNPNAQDWDKADGSKAWGERLIESLHTHKTKLSPTTALLVAMELLASRSRLPCPDLVQEMIDRGLIPPKTLAKAQDVEGLKNWAESVEALAKKDDYAPVLELLHAMGFPFGAAEQLLDAPSPWLKEQRARQEQRALQASTPTPPRAASRPRL